MTVEFGDTRLPLRFWKKVRVDAATGCWPWTGAGTLDGYGSFYAEGRLRRSTRLVWERLCGALGPEQLALHRCDNPPCVNPAHLFLGTNADNARDRDAKGRGRIWTAEERARVSAQVREVASRGAFRGEGNGHARLTPDTVRAIRSEYAAREGTQAEIGSKYGVSHATVSDIVRRRRWGHV